MKKFETLGRTLSKKEQKSVRGGDTCLEEFVYDCCLPNVECGQQQLPCCENLRCEENATSSGTICVPI